MPAQSPSTSQQVARVPVGMRLNVPTGLSTANTGGQNTRFTYFMGAQAATDIEVFYANFYATGGFAVGAIAGLNAAGGSEQPGPNPFTLMAGIRTLTVAPTVTAAQTTGATIIPLSDISGCYANAPVTGTNIPAGTLIVPGSITPTGTGPHGELIVGTVVTYPGTITLSAATTGALASGQALTIGVTSASQSFLTAGSRSLFLPSGALLGFDPLPIEIAAGQAYEVATNLFLSSGSGQYPISRVPYNALDATLGFTAASNTDYSLTPASIVNSYLTGYCPINIKGTVAQWQRSMAISGDSIAYGTGEQAGVADSRGCMGYIERALSFMGFGWTNLSRGGDKLAWTAPNAERLLRSQALSQRNGGFSDLISELDINDIGTVGATAAQIIGTASTPGTMQTLWAAGAQRGMRVWQCLPMPYASSSLGLPLGSTVTVAAGGTGYTASTPFTGTVAGGTLAGQTTLTISTVFPVATPPVVTFTSPVALPGGPVTITYASAAGDTTAVQASGIAAAINANATLAAAGISATVATNIVTIRNANAGQLALAVTPQGYALFGNFAFGIVLPPYQPTTVLFQVNSSGVVTSGVVSNIGYYATAPTAGANAPTGGAGSGLSITIAATTQGYAGYVQALDQVSQQSFSSTILNLRAAVTAAIKAALAAETPAGGTPVLTGTFDPGVIMESSTVPNTWQPQANGQPPTIDSLHPTTSGHIAASAAIRKAAFN